MFAELNAVEASQTLLDAAFNNTVYFMVLPVCPSTRLWIHIILAKKKKMNKGFDGKILK